MKHNLFKIRLAGTDTYIGFKTTDYSLREMQTFSGAEYSPDQWPFLFWKFGAPRRVIDQLTRLQYIFSVFSVNEPRRDIHKIASLKNGIEIVNVDTGEVTFCDIKQKLLQWLRSCWLGPYYLNDKDVRNPIRIGGLERALGFVNPKFFITRIKDEKQHEIDDLISNIGENNVFAEYFSLEDIFIENFGMGEDEKIFIFSWDVENDYANNLMMMLVMRNTAGMQYNTGFIKDKFQPLYDIFGYSWDELVADLAKYPETDYNRLRLDIDI